MQISTRNGASITSRCADRPFADCASFPSVHSSSRGTSERFTELTQQVLAHFGGLLLQDDSCSACPGNAASNLKKMQDALDASGRKVLLSGEGGPDPKECSITGQW
eukprot:SAG31_NODE_2785_length_5092_cov_4.652914_4_plen_106_part_00